MHKLILYYNYTYIANTEELKLQQIELCKSLGLKGRIIVSEEGINGTLEGEESKVAEYISALKADKRFTDTHIKSATGNGKSFPKLNVKVRSELVSAHLGSDDINPKKSTGKYLSADELHRWYEEGKEFYVVDMRNDYEHKVGYFDNSILAPLKNFRDLPQAIDSLSHLKDKTVVTVCTGGVRCEKASGYLVQQGFKDVYQLYGGIQTFMEKYPNEYFLGKLYVFDGRVTWAANAGSSSHVIVGKCEICGKSSDSYRDCSYLHCKNNRHFIGCDDCLDADGSSFCSENCRQHAISEQKFYDKKKSE